MAGKGVYTQYIPPNDPKVEFLKKLYSKSPVSPFASGEQFGGSTNDVVAKDVAAVGNKYLLAKTQTGDAMQFPNGVKMDYSDAPDITKVKWDKQGDPSTGYFPDLISATDGVPNASDPGIANADIKPNYVPGDKGTVNPDVTSDSIYAANQLLAPIVKGKSTL
jgi:hypothetical protein